MGEGAAVGARDTVPLASLRGYISLWRCSSVLPAVFHLGDRRNFAATSFGSHPGIKRGGRRIVLLPPDAK